MRKQNSFERLQTPAEIHRVRYGVSSELYLTLTRDRGVREQMILNSAAEFRKYCKRLHVDLYTKRKCYTL